MRNAGFSARFGASRFHDDERLVQNQSPARGRLESLPVPGIFEIREDQLDLRVLQQVLQIIGKTQHTLVAGGDPVTKRYTALFRCAENIRTQGATLTDDGCQPRLCKTTVDTDAKRRRDSLWT